MSRRPFSEIREPPQARGGPRLRYFQNDYFDLFVWYEDDGRFWGFQLCYDRGFEEHALTWRRASGRTVHQSVNESRHNGFGGTPLLHETTAEVPLTVGPRFRESASTLPPEVLTLVESALGASLGARWK